MLAVLLVAQAALLEYVREANVPGVLAIHIPKSDLHAAASFNSIS